MTAQLRLRQLDSPGKRPITFVRRMTSPRHGPMETPDLFVDDVRAFFRSLR